MSYGGMDLGWLSSLFSSNAVPAATAMSAAPAMAPAAVPTPMGSMPISPEMGGGAQRMLGAQTVDALGPGGSYVNAASAVAQGQQPTFGDTLKDRLGIGTPNGMSEADTAKMLEALAKMAAAQQQGQQRGRGEPAAPAQISFNQAQSLQRPQRALPRYQWSPRSAPAGLLYEG